MIAMIMANYTDIVTAAEEVRKWPEIRDDAPKRRHGCRDVASVICNGSKGVYCISGKAVSINTIVQLLQTSRHNSRFDKQRNFYHTAWQMLKDARRRNVIGTKLQRRRINHLQ